MANRTRHLTPGELALVIGPTVGSHPNRRWEQLAIPAPTRTNLLFITYTKTPADYLSLWTSWFDTKPANAGVLTVSPILDGTTVCKDPLVFEGKVVRAPANLTTIEVRLLEWLDTWQGNASSGQTVVCVDSLTALLQYVSVSKACAFLTALRNLLSDADASTYFHLDPSAHDADTIARVADRVSTAFAFDPAANSLDERSELSHD